MVYIDVLLLQNMFYQDYGIIVKMEIFIKNNK
jgi:hypothetical protein